jgi:GTP-binding protein
LLVLLTKSDKLTRAEAGPALAGAQALLGEVATDESDVAVSLFSALKKSGVGDAAKLLYGWVHPG